MAIDPQLQLAITHVVDLADKVGGASTAVLTLSITFLKDIVRQPDRTDRMLITSAWIGYLLAIICGFWTRMAVAGSLASTTAITELAPNARIPAGIQIVLFVLSTALFIAYGKRGLQRHTPAPPK
jgi:hypothetical protein